MKSGFQHVSHPYPLHLEQPPAGRREQAAGDAAGLLIAGFFMICVLAGPSVVFCVFLRTSNAPIMPSASHASPTLSGHVPHALDCKAAAESSSDRASFSVNGSESAIGKRCIGNAM